MSEEKHWVFVIGAGPAGLYAAKKLSESGARVVILNRDIKPGGLAEYGIFPNKHAMKEGLRKQYRKILTHPLVSYFGNVRVGEDGTVSFGELEKLNPSAIVVSAGAQGTKSLGLPGEDAKGVYHAKDIVYHYNHLPPFSQKQFPFGNRLGIIGLGNVMADISNYACNLLHTPNVLAIGRRGPGERKYTKPEFAHFSGHFDREGFHAEIARIRPALEEVGEDGDKILREIEEDVPPQAPTGNVRFCFRFLSSPKEILKDEKGRVRALRVEKNRLVKRGAVIREQATGEFEEIPLDTVVFAIGDRVDEKLGLPYKDGIFLTDPKSDPLNPEHSLFRVYDPKQGAVIPGRYVIGWARKASEGLVGKARQDAEKGAAVVLHDLEKVPKLPTEEIETRINQLQDRLRTAASPAIPYEKIQTLEQVEQAEAKKRGLEEFKFSSNEEMLQEIAKSAR